MYSPEIGEQVLKFMGEGYSFTACAGKLMVAPGTLHRWANEHPEFGEIAKVAQGVRVAKLEQDAIKSDNAAVINFRKFALGNAARRIADKQNIDTRDWAPESSQIALSNADGSNLAPPSSTAELAIAMVSLIAQGQDEGLVVDGEIVEEGD